MSDNNPPLSRAKVEAWLRAAKTDTLTQPLGAQYFWCSGRNTLADLLMVEIAMGRMDEGETPESREQDIMDAMAKLKPKRFE